MDTVPLSGKLARAGIYLLMFTPLVYVKAMYHPYTAPKAFFIIAVSEFAVLAYIWLIRFHPQWRMRLGSVGQTLVAFVAVLTLASVLGVDPMQSFWGSAERDLNMIVWLHLGAIFFVINGVFRSREDWYRLLSVSVWVAVAAAAIHLLSLSDAFVLSSMRRGATFGNSSLFGTYLLFQVFFATLLVVVVQGWKRWMWMFVAVVLAFVLFSSTATAATWSLFGGLALALGIFVALHARRKSWRIIAIICSVLLVSSFAALFVLALVPESAVRAWVVAHTSGARFVLWEIAWRAWKARPVFGWGFENFSSAFFQYYHSCFGSAACGGEFFFDRSHNIFLDVLVFSGLVGLVAYLSIFGALFAKLWRAFHARTVLAGEISILIGLVATYIAQNLTVFDTATSALFFVVVLAYVNTLGSQTLTARKQLNAFVPVVATFLIPFCFLSFVIQPARATIATRSAALTPKLSVRLPLYERATTLSPWGQEKRRTYLGAQTATVLWDLEEQKREQGRTLLEQELGFARVALLDSIVSSPGLLHSYLALGFVDMTWGRYYDPGKYEESRQILSRAVELNQRNPATYWALGMVALDMGEGEEALALARTALDLNDSVFESRARYLVVLKLAQADKDQIDAFASQTLDMFPSQRLVIETLQSADPQTYRDQLLFKLYYDAGGLK